MPVNLLDFDLDGLTAFCEGLGEKRFRAVQLYRWIHQKGASDFARMTDLAKSRQVRVLERERMQAMVDELRSMDWAPRATRHRARKLNEVIERLQSSRISVRGLISSR